MIGFFVVLVLLMVLVAVCVPMLQGGGGRRVVYTRRPDYVESDIVEVVDDEPPLRPIARRRTVRRSRRY